MSMTKEEYYSFIQKQQTLLTDKVKAAIAEQNRLHGIAQEKMRIRDELDDKSRDLIIAGHKELLAKYPEIEELFPTTEIKQEMISELVKDFQNSTDRYKEITSKMLDIPEFQENRKILDKLNIANYEFYKALANLNKKIASDRKELFTKEYLKVMDDYADKGLLLYFLETPDIPLLDESINETLLIDTFLVNDCYSLWILLQECLTVDTPIMKRKSIDLQSALDAIGAGYFRSAARDMFALIEHEHKRCANAFEGYFNKKKEYKKGIQRSKKISELINRIDNLNWEKHAWEKIDQYYKKLTAKEITEGVCNRNGIIHGDYQDNVIDITEYDCVKLILLWVNIRVIVDKIIFLEQEYDDMISVIAGACCSVKNSDEQK